MGILDLILPAACVACRRYGDLLCRQCRGRMRPAASPEDRFLAPDGGVLVGEDLELAVAAFAHDGPVRRALQQLKYGGAGRIAAPLAEAAVPAFGRLLAITHALALVPVPVHAERLRQRGYNQAGLIAAALSRTTGLPVADLLERRLPTTRQHHLDRGARIANLRGAFAMREGARAPPRVILVDDILTTSATLESCARVLRSAGAARVHGFAIAREV